MLTIILLLTLMPLAVLIIGFFDLKLPFVSEHPEMHLLTLLKESIINLFHFHHHDKNSTVKTVPA
jgi:hypothetical protein